MADNNDFATVLKKFVERDGRTVREIAQASATLFGLADEVPHGTISRWLRGKTKKPRKWQLLLKLAIVLGLSEGEANELLYATKYGHMAKLHQATTDDSDKKLLSHWDKSNSVSAPLSPLAPPRDLANFTGREAKLKALKKKILLKKGIFCLQGMAGVGKTSLAIHLAHQLHQHFPDGILWAELNRSEPMSVLYAFADAYGIDVSGYTDLATRSSKVRSILADKQALIILDDVERDEQLRDLLPPTESSVVLITTRQHDLSVADDGICLELKPFNVKESGDLFATILGEGRTKGWEGSDLRKIAELLGHLPLAIAIVANRLKKEPYWLASHFLAKLRRGQQRLDLLARGTQNVRLSFEISYQALPPELQLFFAALGLFEGEDFSVEASAYVAGIQPEESEDYLRLLYNLSLIQLARPQRYKLHPLLRHYSQEQTRSPEYIERLVTYFVHYIVAHAKDYTALEQEKSNLLAALPLAHQQEMKAALVRGVTALYPFLRARGLYRQAKKQLEQAEKAAEAMGDIAAQATILHQWGRLAIKQGEIKQAKAKYERGLALARQTTDRKRLCALLNSLGILADKRGDSAQAKEYYHEGMVLAEEADDVPRIVSLLTNLGVIAIQQGDHKKAKQCYLQALGLAGQLGKKNSQATLLQNLGDLSRECGDYQRSQEYFSEGLDIANELDEPDLKSRLLGNMGLLAVAERNYIEATELFQKGLQLAQESQLTQQISRQRANLGQVMCASGKYNEANLHYQEAMKLARRSNFPFDSCVILNQWGFCYLTQKKWSQAKDAFSEALSIAQSATLQQEMGMSLYGLASLAVRDNELEQAHQLGLQSYQLFTAMGHQKANELEEWLSQLSLNSSPPLQG